MSPQATDLLLTTMAEGALYADREHAGFAMLQGASHRISFRDIVTITAREWRAKGSRYSAAQISEAASEVQKQTIEHCLELIRNEGGPVTCYGRKWRDKVNGNTYFSACIVVGKRWLAVPVLYGYGNQWEHECAQLLARIGVATVPLFVFEGESLKRNMYKGVYV